MKKASIRNLSVLGLVLMAASAVTAAVMPKDKSEKSTAANNRLVESTGGCGNQLTCVTTVSPVDECTVTAGTFTTGDGVHGTSVTEFGGHTTAGGGTGANQNSSQSPC